MWDLIPKRAIKSPQKLVKIFTKSLPIFLNEGFPKGGDAIWEKFPNTPVILSASLKVIGHFAHFGIIFGQLLPQFAIKISKKQSSPPPPAPPPPRPRPPTHPYWNLSANSSVLLVPGFPLTVGCFLRKIMIQIVGMMMSRDWSEKSGSLQSGGSVQHGKVDRSCLLVTLPTFKRLGRGEWWERWAACNIDAKLKCYESFMRHVMLN